ncbi:MAB_1171c family putative transporter [Streptomyces yaizuensis]|uniref:Membrane protein n=1 Tax=Streptomyces yaizuensis TaxID=2989713 RepID=A0ABQ5P1D1_9ACTN|nr:MAB_1171c family putative transporter [Streptomyces sp. YSPA8]GLF96417.1 membrane protein [Streptomyces sp. YSPA8]
MSEDAYDLVYLTVSAAASVMVVVRLVRLRVAASAPLALTTVAVFWGATAFAFGAPTVYRAVGETTGVPNLGTLLVYTSVVIYGGLAQAMALMWTPTEHAGADRERPRIRGPIVRHTLLAALLVLLFLLGRPEGPETPLTFDVDQAGDPVLLVFLLLYQTGWFTACLSVAAVCRGHLRRVGPHEGRVRRGLLCVTTGTLICSTYGITKVIAILGAATGAYRVDVLSNVVGPMASALGAQVIVAGFCYPVLAKWLTDRRDYRQLAPLWRAIVRDHAPRQVLAPAGPLLGRVALGSTGFLLTRRIIEITDAQRSLHPYLSPAEAAAVAGGAERHRLSGADLRAAQDAAGLLAAADRARTGGARAARPPGPAGPGLLATDADARVERDHLVRIARHLDHPAVREAAGRPG